MLTLHCTLPSQTLCRTLSKWEYWHISGSRGVWVASSCGLLPATACQLKMNEGWGEGLGVMQAIVWNLQYEMCFAGVASNDLPSWFLIYLSWFLIYPSWFLIYLLSSFFWVGQVHLEFFGCFFSKQFLKRIVFSVFVPCFLSLFLSFFIFLFFFLFLPFFSFLPSFLSLPSFLLSLFHPLLPGQRSRRRKRERT